MTSRDTRLDEQEKKNITNLLMDMFADRTTDLSKLLMFLGCQDSLHKDPNNPSPFWKMLHKVYSDGKLDLLRECAEQMIKEYNPGFDNQMIHNAIRDLNEGMPEHICDESDSDNTTRELLMLNKQSGKLIGGFGTVGVGVVETVNALPWSTKHTMASKAAEVGRTCGFNRVETVVATLSRDTKIVPVALASACLAADALVCMCRWWRDKISGKRCLLNVLEGICSGIAGVAGGVGGAALGTSVLPGVGSIVGGIIGGIVSTMVIQKLSESLLVFVFDIPKSVALENAFRFLGVKHNASNGQINSAYRKLCHKYHPDTGGNIHDFTLLQVHLTTIKLARGEKFDKGD